jgi:hypothetical protein
MLTPALAMALVKVAPVPGRKAMPSPIMATMALSEGVGAERLKGGRGGKGLKGEGRVGAEGAGRVSEGLSGEGRGERGGEGGDARTGGGLKSWRGTLRPPQEQAHPRRGDTTLPTNHPATRRMHRT